MYQPIRYTRVIPIRQDVVLPEPPYAGPGNVVSGAVHWWGLRAYTLAGVGANAVRLRRDSDNAESDFATITGGGLDLSSISSFKGAANLFLVTLYDQAGGTALDLTNATSSTQLQFILGGLGSKPVLRSTTNLTARANGGLVQTSPWTLSTVVKRTADFSVAVNCFGDTNGSAISFQGPNQMAVAVTGTSSSAVSATDNVFHAVQSVGNSASSDCNIDGTVNTYNASGATTQDYGGGGSRTDINLAFSWAFKGDWLEGGLWAVAFSGSQSSSMSANQHSYWGF